MVEPENAKRAAGFRALSPNELHEKLSDLYSRLERISEGTGQPLAASEFATLLHWVKFSVECSSKRLELMRSVAEQVPSMGYPKSAETMILALIENWFFEGDEKARTGLLEAVRKSVLDKAPSTTSKGEQGVRLATDDQTYHRTNWGQSLGKKASKVGTGKAERVAGDEA